MATISYTHKELAEKQNKTIFKLPTTFSWGGPKFDARGLKLVISYILSDNECINRRIYRRLVEYFDEAEVFYGDSKDPLLKKLCSLAVAALDARVRSGLPSRDRIIMDMKSRQGFEFDEREFPEVTTTDIAWIENFASNIIDDLNTARYLPKIAILKDRINAAAIADRPAAIDALYDMMNQMINLHNEIKSDNEESNEITFADATSADVAIDHFIATKQNDSEKLQTGIHALNDMLGGGFERKRVYAFMGIAGTGKSMTLLDLMYQLKMHNPHITPKDKTKTPAIVMLTMENSVDETIERLVSMTCGSVNWKQMTSERIKEMLTRTGVFPASLLNDNACQTFGYNTCISIVYKPGDSVDTSYLYELYDDMDKKGFEIQALFMDYIARIRCIGGDNKDLMARLGCNSNEFKVFATAKDIPIITAAQVNRVGAQLISDRKNGRCAGNNRANLPYDLVTGIVAEHVSDSHKLIHNIDVAIAIVPEFEGNNEKNRKWMGFKCLKSRCATSTENSVMFVPYDIDKKCKFVEDPLQGAPVTRWSMSSIYTAAKGIEFNSNCKPAPKSAYMNEGMEAVAVSAVAEKVKNEPTTFFNMKKAKIDEKSVEKSVAAFLEDEPKIDMEAIKMERNAIAENVKIAQQRYSEMMAFINNPYQPENLIRPFVDPNLIQPFDRSYAANYYQPNYIPQPQPQLICPFDRSYAANCYQQPQPQSEPIPERPLVQLFSRAY